MLGSNMSLQVIRPSEHAMTQFAFDVWFFVGLLVSNKLVLIFVPVKKKIMSFQMRVSIIRKTGNISWKAGFDDIQWDSWDSLTVRGILDMPTDVLDRAAPDVGPNFFPFEMWDYNHRTDEPVLYEPCVSWLWNKSCKLTYYLLKKIWMLCPKYLTKMVISVCRNYAYIN